MKTLILTLCFFVSTISIYAQGLAAVQLFKSDYRDNSYPSQNFEEVEPYIVKNAQNGNIGLIYTDLSHSAAAADVYIPEPWYWDGPLPSSPPEILLSSWTGNFLASQLHILSNNDWVIITRNKGDGEFKYVPEPGGDFEGTYYGLKVQIQAQAGIMRTILLLRVIINQFAARMTFIYCNI